MIEYFTEGSLWLRDSFVLGRAANLYFFMTSSIPFLTTSVLVVLFFSQYSTSLLCVSSSILALTSIVFGLSTFGLPVRGLILSPRLSVPQLNNNYYGSKSQAFFKHSFSCVSASHGHAPYTTADSPSRWILPFSESGDLTEACQWWHCTA